MPLASSPTVMLAPAPLLIVLLMPAKMPAPPAPADREPLLVMVLLSKTEIATPPPPGPDALITLLLTMTLELMALMPVPSTTVMIKLLVMALKLPALIPIRPEAGARVPELVTVLESLTVIEAEPLSLTSAPDCTLTVR